VGVQDVPAFGCVRSMSRIKAKSHRDPIAVTSSGELLVNVGLFDEASTLDEILRRAKKEQSFVFVGVVIEADEMPLVADRVHDACREAAAFIEGGRRRRRAGRGGKT
jgi:hypothetical protein